jgi:DNA-binding MarR family transcriptional regulator
MISTLIITMENISKSPSVGEPGIVQESVLRSLRRIIRAVDLYSRRLVVQTGLSGPQLICMRQLAAEGALQTTQLADSVNLSAATVCGILNRLEQRGLVVRERQIDDRRCVLVSLSEAGQDTVANAPPALHDSFSFRFGALSSEQQQQIDNTLGLIVSMMAAEDLDAAPILVPGEAVTPGPERKT